VANTQDPRLTTRQAHAAEEASRAAWAQAHPGDPAAQGPLAALCLSGGGIRSASFALGVLQVLARQHLLRRFHYLSTVSGGGYIGTWLQALIHHHGLEPALADLEKGARPNTETARLRRYTNFLSPEPGFLSLDVWTDVILYIRNVLLNWTVVLPLLMAVVIAPILLRTFVWTVQVWPGLQQLMLWVSAGALGVSTYFAATGLPNHRERPRAASNPDQVVVEPLDFPAILWRIALPFGAWMVLVPACLVTDPAQDPVRHLPWLVVVYFLALWMGYVAAGVHSARRRDPNLALFWRNAAAWLLACLASSALLALGVHLGRAAFGAARSDGITILIVAAPLWLAVSNAVHSAVFVGARRDGRLFDMDREWLARLSAVKLLSGALAAGLIFCAVGLVPVLEWLDTPAGWATLTTPLAAGPLVAWGGKKMREQIGAMAKGVPGWREWSMKWLLNLGGIVFMVALIASLGMLVQAVILARIQHWLAFDWDHSRWGLLVLHVGLGAVLSLLIWQFTNRVNINRFSMHALYRNRLTRAFLGSARGAARVPDGFTDFDANDNLPVSMLRAAPNRSPWPLFPLINLTLNLTSSHRMDWLERKAGPFVVTPLHCGSSALADDGAYVSTARYGGHENPPDAGKALPDRGISVATAMTISGAAVSPSWGYNSSPLTAFLMALFNVRLGAWLPNPATVTDPALLALGRPQHAIRPMIGDLLGLTDATSASIYLTDGGHFENLGLYEAIRRRCAVIVVSDGGQDGSCQFEDLGNAIRKVRIDMGVEIRFPDPFDIHPRGDNATSAGYALGTIEYPAVPEQSLPPATGRIVYLKPCFIHGMPSDCNSYGLMNKSFPHESTLDQWFSESQFESYRSLGAFQAERMLAGIGPDKLFAP